MTSAKTEDWKCRSWIASANEPDCGFPLQSLPFCAFVSEEDSTHIGVGVGDQILDLHACAANGLLASLSSELQQACSSSILNDIMQLGHVAIGSLRETLMLLLREDANDSLVEMVTPCLRQTTGTQFRMPVRVGNYTDFYASVHHATNVGRLFRPDQPLLPNYKYIPIGYHGRASSIVISNTPVTRPNGQTKSPSAAVPQFGPSRQLDYEVEVGAYTGEGNQLGSPIPIDRAEQHIFGFSLVNDWSARDIQAWEYQPLGPFLGKSFATTVSPWVVTPAALAPFRVPLTSRPHEDPKPMPYLHSLEDAREGLDVQLEASISTAKMRERSLPPFRLSTANGRDLYWSFAQMVTHHTSNGCNLLPGDLLASGTVSGPIKGSQGCLLEITRRGAEPLSLPGGETRTFLEDGDEIILSGICRREGYPSISFGECCGIVLPAHS